MDLWGLESGDKVTIIILTEQESKTIEAGIPIMPIIEGKFTITDTYGPRDPVIINGKKGCDFHKGTDMGAQKGTPIRSVYHGTVIETSYNSIYGNFVKIQHTESTITFYAHMETINVSNGDYVVGGQKIGEVCSTGFSTGPHLHYEIIMNGKSVNPHF